MQPVLVSPSGMESPLQAPQVGATSSGILDWSYLTNAFWGEDPAGTWTMKLTDLPWSDPGEQSTQVTWDLFQVTARYGSLIEAQPGDFDADGDVDGSDFLVWQRDYGQTARLRSDDNNDGLVDAADYTIWRDNYGQGGTQALAAVPEPASAGLVALGVASVLGVHHRRRASFSVAA